MDSTRPSIFFYDAKCWLCRICRDWMDPEDPEQLLFVDANDKALAATLGVSDLNQLDQRACLLRANGQTVWGYDGIVAALGTFPQTVPIASLLARPTMRLIGTAVYDQVARSRRCSAQI